MRIIYKQENNTYLEMMGIESLIIKHIFCEADTRFVSLKKHHHTCFEVHFVRKGCQTYRIGDRIMEINEGSGLVIAPKTKHTAVSYVPGTEKISFSFSLRDGKEFGDFIPGEPEVRVFKTDERLSAVADSLLTERKNSFAYSNELCSALAFELIVLFERLFAPKKIAHSSVRYGTDARIMMAKQYIGDNIELDLKVEDIASYCYMGVRQLTRLFKECEFVTPAAYIRQKRVERIEKLLHTKLTLAEISEKMHFNSEYHFNSFFRKYSGMPPGEFRRMNNE